MLITPAALNFLFTELHGEFQKGFDRYKPRYDQIAERIPSSTLTNTYSFLGDIPGFREWVGPRIFHNLAARPYAVTNKDWELSFDIQRNVIEDDQFGMFSRTSSIIGGKAARLWDDLVFDALKNGNSRVCWDGQYFFDTDHPVDPDSGAAGTYSNNIAATDLTMENINLLAQTMMGFKGMSGNAMEIVPNLLVVPPALALKANLAVKAPVYSTGSVALPNPMADGQLLGQTIDILVVPRLNDQPTVYYLISTAELKPIILQVRKEAEFVSRTEPTQDNVFHRKTYEYGADARGAAGYGLPFTAMRVSTV